MLDLEQLSEKAKLDTTKGKISIAVELVLGNKKQF